MLDQDTVKALARELDQAEKTRTLVRQVSRRHPDMTIEDAYAVQRAWLELMLADGKAVKGWKIGLTSRAMQQAVQITEPDYAPLMDSMFFATGADVPIDRFIAPRVEVEFAFILGKDLEGPGVTIFDVLDATEYVVPAAEIIDARIEMVDRETGGTRKVFDTISDFAANAGVVPGGRPIRPLEVDLRWAGAMMYRNGVIEETGLAAGVLNHPATGVAWLANRIAPHGARLKAGEFVLSGSFTRPVHGARGDTFHVDYGPLGAVSFRFA